MRRLLLSVAVLTALGTAGTAGASGPVFSIVPETQPMTAFASAEVPNSGLVLPPSYLTPRSSNGLPFPVLHGSDAPTGMTLRDYFAGQALAGGLEQGVENDWHSDWWHDPGKIAKRAYEIADAMLRVRGRV